MPSISLQFLALLVSSIPLYFALRLMKGKAKKAPFIKVFLVNVLIAAIASAVSSSFGLLSGVISFLLALFIYKEMFETDWLTAFLIWLMQIIIVAMIFGALMILGISLVLF